MGKHTPPKLKEDISPNLVPMIDIMFLLLLFFMLGADMAQRESVDVMLPKASMVKEDRETGEDPTTTVNIYHDKQVACPVFDNGGVCREKGHWLWSIRGHDYTLETIKPRLQADADDNLEADVDPLAGKRLSGRKLLVRADRTAPYGDVQKVIEVSGSVGLYKVEVAGAKPSSGPGSTP